MPYLEQGSTLPKFRYDAPYAAQQPITELYRSQPAVMVFLSNFGHPVTRAVVKDYLSTLDSLQGCSLACVVHSRHESVGRALQGRELPFTMICDADGELYRHFEIPQETSPLRYSSLRAAAILHKAKKEGYSPKGQPQQLPLTLVVDTDGTILFAHYGRSLTDLPENCAAISELAAQAAAARPQAEEAAEEPAEEPQAEEPAESLQPDAAQPQPESIVPEPEQAPTAPSAPPAEGEGAADKYKTEQFTLESFFQQGSQDRE